MTDVVVAGGGIIGLSLAYELASRGRRVTVLEQGEWGGQASSAAAGMLAPLKEFPEPGPMLELGMNSLASYPGWAARLLEETGMDVQLAMRGILTVALTESEAAALQAKYRWQREAGYRVDWLQGEALREREPLLSPAICAGIWSMAEGEVNNGLLLQALQAACVRRGVSMRKGAVVTAIHVSGCRVRGVMTSEGLIEADQTIVTAGAWSAMLLNGLGIALPVRPVRGQVAAVSGSGIGLRHVIFGSGGYIVPKQDGRIVLGATEDEAGFAREVTLAGLTRVLEGIRPYVPALQQAPFLQAWAGLRPATTDGLPLLGPVPGWVGIGLATGHYRNGILLAPITAKRIADWLDTGDASPLQPFAFGRFQASAPCPG